MKKILTIILIISLILVVGCGESFQEKDKIESPATNAYPISGVFQTVQSEVHNLKVKYSEIRKLEFILNKVIVDNKTYDKVQYKVKRVDSNQYALQYFECTKEEVNIKKNNINVISVFQDSKLVVDVIYLDENNIIVNDDNKVAFLKKTTGEIDSTVEIQSYNDESEKYLKNDKEGRKSTLLLGVRWSEDSKKVVNDQSEDDGLEVKEAYKYGTIAINTVNGVVNKVIQIPYIVIPRKSGFWFLDNYSVFGPNGYENAFQAYLVPETDINIIHSKEKRNIDPYLDIYDNERKDHVVEHENIVSFKEVGKDGSRINFINDNYIGFETGVINSSEGTKDYMYSMYNIDSLNKKSVPLKSIMSSEDYKNIEDMDKNFAKKGQTLQQYNFAMKRRNGYWYIMGRVTDNKTGEYREDVMMNVIPSNSILNYDELHISWNEIKAANPLATDAYCSPEDDIIVIITDNKLYINELDNNGIGETLYEMRLNNSEVPIMAEWALKDYAEKWIRWCEKIQDK